MLPVRVGEYGDWRLSDEDFLTSFDPLNASRSDALARMHPHARDPQVVFEEPTHSYYVDGEKYPHSVTSFLHGFIAEFEPAEVLSKMQSRSDWQVKRAKYSKEDGSFMEPQEIIAFWKKNGEVQRARGQLLHYHAEQYINGRVLERPHSPEFHQIELACSKFRSEGWCPFRTEFTLFDEATRLAGQADLLCKDDKGNIVVVDWKRTREIQYSRLSQMKPPLEHLPDCNYSLYCLQLNLYAHILERRYDFVVSRLLLVIVHPSMEVPEIIECPRLPQEVENLLAFAASRCLHRD